MGRKCAARGCRSGYNNEKKVKGVTMHRFPLKDKELTKKWVEMANLRDYQPTSNSAFCSLHFDDSCFVTRSQDTNVGRKRNFDEPALKVRRIAVGAFPSIFPSRTLDTNTIFAPETPEVSAEQQQPNTEDETITSDESEMFQEEEELNSCDDIVAKLETEESSLPPGFDWKVKNDKLYLLYIIEDDDLRPTIAASVVIQSNLNVSVYIGEVHVDSKTFSSFLDLDNKVRTFTNFINLLASIKPRSTEPEVRDELNDLIHCVKNKLNGLLELDDSYNEKIKFFMEQIDLMVTPKSGRRYSSRCILMSYLLHAASPNGYSELRNQDILCLPSERTLRSIKSKVGKADDCAHDKSRYATLNNFEKNVMSIIDEIYANKKIGQDGGIESQISPRYATWQDKDEEEDL